MSMERNLSWEAYLIILLFSVMDNPFIQQVLNEDL